MDQAPMKAFVHRSSTRSTGNGFTLIELVVVIAIVAVLIAAALPRMSELQRQARIGHLNSARGAVYMSSTLVHATLIARMEKPDAAPCPAGGAPGDNRLVGSGTLCTEHGLVRTRNGYPASTPLATGLPGIVAAAGIGTVFDPTPEQLRAEGYVVDVAGPVTTFARADAPTPSLCKFTYTEPLAARTAATVSAALVSGC